MQKENIESTPCKIESTDVQDCGGLPRSSKEVIVMMVERRGQRAQPNLTDRIAQMAVVLSIMPSLDSIFHEDSYGYRPNKCAHDAIAKARERCFKYAWVLDMDISKFFDTQTMNC